MGIYASGGWVTPMSDDEVDSSASSRADKSVQVTLKNSVHQRLEELKELSGMTHSNILFDVIEFSYDRLGDLIENRGTLLEAGRTKLFDRPSSPAKPSDEPTTTFIVKVSQKSKDFIDELWRKLDAPNRTAMLAPAYEYYINAQLPKLRKQREEQAAAGADSSD